MSESTHLPEPEIFFGPRPKYRMVAFYRRLCEERGVAPVQLLSVAHARREVETVRELPVLPVQLRRDEDQAVVREMHEEFGGATRFREDETEGYGSSARWA